MSIAVELKQVSKHFGAKRAVDNVSFTVEQGQCYGLIGPNGAGKTTTFSMLCGYLYPTTGTLTVLGAEPMKAGALKRKVGVLPQDAVLPPTWPVGELLMHYARLSGLPEPKREATDALSRVGLPETWGVPAGALSHGMAKRVAMAQALMGKPPLVLLDEPTAGLDPKIAAQVRGLIRELKGRTTLIVSSHNLAELEELCDATALLDKGKLVKAASMAEMTGQTAEFRVQVAKGYVPADDVRTVAAVTKTQMESNGTVLAVYFDSSQAAPEVVITAVLKLLISREVLVLGVTRGERLEQKVLQLT